jgi:hypothetical protein
VKMLTSRRNASLLIGSSLRSCGPRSSWGSVIVNSPDVGEAKASRIPYSSGNARLARSSTLFVPTC